MKLINKIVSSSAAVLAATGALCINAAMAEQVEIGEYVQIGEYNNTPIVWRVAAVDENGPLLMSDEILCLKEFDAAGTGGTHSNNEYREKGGSPVWSESNLRAWLTSEANSGEVVWPCGNPPSSYKDEKGFLHNDNFSGYEKQLMKNVTQKTIVSKIDTNVEGFKSGSDFSVVKGSTWEQSLTSNYESCAYQPVTDKIFIPDARQAESIKNNLGKEFLIRTFDNKYQYTWLRQAAGTYYAWAGMLWNSENPGENYGAVWRTDAKTLCGVRPAFYFDSEAAAFSEGSGTKESPYVLSNSICTISIDGNKADVDGGLINLPSGEHEIEVNYLSESDSSTLYAALYDDNRLVKLMLKQGGSGSGEGLFLYNISGKISIPQIHNSYSIKIFEWKSDNITPVKEAVSKTERMFNISKGEDKTYKNGDIVGFIGDEITKNGTYVDNIQSFYALRYPDRKIKIVNLGQDAADTKAVIDGFNSISASGITKANILLGMNDVGIDNYHKNDMGNNSDVRSEAIDKYIDNMNTIADNLSKEGINDINIMTPSLFDQTKQSNAMLDNPILANDGLEIMGERLKNMNDVSVYELNDYMQKINSVYQINDKNATIIGDDLKTPGGLGNMIMTYLYLQQQGFDGEVARVFVNTADNKLENTNCSVYNYQIYNNYVSYDYKPAKLPLPVTDDYKTACKYVSLTDELNREIIKVQNLDKGTYSLSVDAAELGIYTAEDFANGVNIAENELYSNAVSALKADELAKSGDVDALYSFVNDQTAKTHKVEIVQIKSDDESKLSLHSLFDEDMVLQRGKNHTIWGKAVSGTNVSVMIYNSDNPDLKSEAMSTADESGMWKVDLTPLPEGGPYEMMVVSENQCIKINDVYIGDVFVLAGQSNMERSYNMALNKDGLSEDKLKSVIESNNIKYMKITNVSSSAPTYDIKTDTDAWDSLDSTNNRDISLIGMYFAEKRISEQPDVPVGIISTAWGGTPIERWIKDGNIFNNHIAPITDYKVSAVLWYQGESNSGPSSNPQDYAVKFKNMINDYRNLWGEDDLPFFYVQLARYSGNGFDYTPIRQVQLDTLKAVANTQNIGMVTTLDTDKGSYSNIHPYGKETIAERLNLMYKNMVLGETDVVYTGPLFKSAVYDGGKVIVEFEDYSIGSGLKVKDVYENNSQNTLNEFEIAGEDGVFVPATATVTSDNKIEITGVENPKYVRYAYSKVPQNPNLFNNEDLPASPFTAEVTSNSAAY